MAITPLVYPPWNRFGLTVEQHAEIAEAERRMEEFPLADAIEEAKLSLFWEGLPEVSPEILQAAVWDARHSRKWVVREVKKHARTCSGCDECMPPAPQVEEHVLAGRS